MSDMMQAAVIGPDGLDLAQVPIPVPAPHQMLVRVHFAALNRADLAMSAGHKHGNAGGRGTVAGLEWSGEVVATGAKVTDFAIGDAVMCSGAGGYAEYALTDASRCNPIPAFTQTSDVDFARAATLPVALTTMHDALVTNGRLRAGETVLIQGASAGVGILGMQIAKYMGASLVIGTSTHSERRAKLVGVGADLALDSADPGWVEAVREATDGQGVDLIVDQVSGGVANDNMRAAAIKGRIVNVGRLGGMHDDFNFDLHALKRLHYIGVTFRTRSREEVAAINTAMRADLWTALEDGVLHIPVDRTFALTEVNAAQTYMRENRHFGKILLAVTGA